MNREQLDRVWSLRKKKLKKDLKWNDSMIVLAARCHLAGEEALLHWMWDESDRETPDIEIMAALMQLYTVHFAHLLYTIYGEDALSEVILKDHADAIRKLLFEQLTILHKSVTGS